MRKDSGQASLEYIVLLVISTLAIGGGAMAVKGEGLAASVLAQFARGICVVSGGDCERDRAPCIVNAQTTSQDLVVVVAVIRLAGGRTIIRQRSSDGTELVTLVESGGAGLGIAGFLAQQAAEKALKAGLFAALLGAPRIHGLNQLLSRYPTASAPRVDVDDLDMLDPWVSPLTPPGSVAATSRR